MWGCLYNFVILPCYLLYYMFVFVGYIMYYCVEVIMYLFILICKIISFFVKKRKEKKQDRQGENYTNYSSSKNNIVNNNYSSKDGIVNNNIDYAYILIRIEKSVGRKIFNGYSINEEEFGIKSYDSIYTSVDFDKKRYYEVEINEDSYNLAGKLLFAMFNK